MLRAPMDKEDIKKDHMGNVSREMKIQRKNQKEMLDQEYCNINKECFQWAY